MTLSDIYEYTINVINQNQFAQGGFVIAAMTWVGYQLKTVPIELYNFIKKFVIFECTITMEKNENTFDAFNKWYSTRYPNKFRKIGVRFENEFDSETNTYSGYNPIYYQESDANYIWFKYQLLKITKVKEKVQNAMHSTDLYNHEYNISGFFAKKSIQLLIETVLEEFNKNVNDNEGIPVVYGHDEFGGSNSKHLKIFKTFDNLYFDGKEDFIKKLDEYYGRKKTLNHHGIKHKLGIKLYGPPGTGKTSIAIAIAHRYNLTLYLLNLGNFKSDQDFIRFICNARPNSLFLFEDEDEHLGKNSRSKMKNESKVSFTTLLQFLDGVLSPEGIITVFTTNSPDEFDPAIYRDGRINIKLNVSHPDPKQLAYFLSNYYNTLIDFNYVDIKEIPMSTIEKICMDTENAHEAIQNILNYKI